MEVKKRKQLVPRLAEILGASREIPGRRVELARIRGGAGVYRGDPEPTCVRSAGFRCGWRCVCVCVQGEEGLN